MLLLGPQPDPEDTALFRMLLADNGGKKPPPDVDRKDADADADADAVTVS